jgi:hypothetical protein
VRAETVPRGVRALAKTGWLAAAIGVAWMATRGLVTGFLSFDSSEAFVSQRRAEKLLAVSGVAWWLLAAVGRAAFGAPTWSVVALGGLGVACLLLTGTELRFPMVPILWATVLGAAGGVLLQPARREKPPPDDVP